MLDRVGCRFVGDIRKTNSELININKVSDSLVKKQYTSFDEIDINKNNKVISFSGYNFNFKQTKNTIHYISFTGLQNPEKQQPLGIQMKIEGVKRFKQMK